MRNYTTLNEILKEETANFVKNISAGQKQLLTITRAMVEDSPMRISDARKGFFNLKYL